ncbi:MAG: hypothetical protein JOZ47_11145 [Kutzneria sp.]|nr:hypothetical protein [Kutzneria sp.]
MINTRAAVDVVIFTDEAGNRYAFTREQLADAKVSGSSPSDLSVTSQSIIVNSELNRRPNGRW